MKRYIHTILLLLGAFIPAIAQPKISPNTVNLGTIYTGDPVSFDFRISNPTEMPLLITAVELPTANLKANYPIDPIPAGGEGIIHATFFTQDLKPGMLVKTIRVRTNGKPSSFRLSVKGNVSDEIPTRQTRNDGIAWTRTYSNRKFGAEVNSKEIIAPAYDNLQYSSKMGNFIGTAGNRLDLLTPSGKKICSAEFQEYFIDNKGLIVMNNYLMSYIDKNGKTIIPFSAGYKRLVHILTNGIGEYFRFFKENSTGITDRNGNATFEMPELPEGRFITPYYIGRKLLYLSNDGIYDSKRNKVISFSKNVNGNDIFSIPSIRENGDIVIPEFSVSPEGKGTLTHVKIGSVSDAKVKESENPYSK